MKSRRGHETGKIRVGTASWSDPGFIADWFPNGLPANERLRWYAQFLDLVEVNSSFYAIPARKMVERWCELTPESFTFDVKLHKLLSRHSAAPDTLPVPLRSGIQTKNGKVMLTPKLEQMTAKNFLQEICPIQEAGKLGAFLLQLSPAFNPFDRKINELDGLVEIFGGKYLAVEFRHRSWLKGEFLPQVKEYFEKHCITFVGVDAPAGASITMMPPVDLVTNSKRAYLRLHGRNTQGYATGRTVAERFDYRYSEEELKEIQDRAEELASQASEVHVIYNNNARDYAPKNAIQFRQMVESHAGVPA